MKQSNGVWVFNLFIPTATHDEARRLALRIAAEMGVSDIQFY